LKKNSGYDLRIEEKHRMIVDLQKNIDDYRQELKQLQHQKTIHQQTKTFKNKKTEINLNEPTTNEKNETNEKKEEKEGIETNRKPFFIIQKQEEIIPIIDLKSEKEIILPQVANIDLNYQHAIKTLKKEKQKNRKIVNFKELLYSYENDKYSIRIKKKYTKTEGNTDEDLNILKPKSSKDFQSNKKTKTQASIDEKINIIYELRNSILNLQNRKNQLEEAVIKVIKQKKKRKEI